MHRTMYERYTKKMRSTAFCASDAFLAKRCICRAYPKSAVHIWLCNSITRTYTHSQNQVERPSNAQNMRSLHNFFTVILAHCYWKCLNITFLIRQMEKKRCAKIFTHTGDIEGTTTAVSAAKKTHKCMST